MTAASLSRILATLAVTASAAAAWPAHAKCNVTLKLTNGNAAKITVLGEDSQARVNGGTWSKMNFQATAIPPGETRDVPWTTNMSCGGNAKRDLRFKYQQASNNNVYTELVENVQIDDGATERFTLKH